MGFTVGRDDPQALEQMRSMLTVKQKQKELIEQRRGSTASILSTAPPSVNIVNPPEHEDERDVRVPPKAQAQTSGQSTSATRRGSSSSRRCGDCLRAVPGHPPHAHPPHPVHSSHPSTSSLRHDSPEPDLHPYHDVHCGTTPHAPAPPISFANRRAGRGVGGAKGKPADIMINPRAGHPENQPAIQSAPPIPRADPTGRFGTMAVPSLPQMSATSTAYAHKTDGRAQSWPEQPGTGGSRAAGRSPQNASVPIASSLVPPTPATLHHPNYSNERSAFLAPFELFYDALADSKQLKNWLADSCRRARPSPRACSASRSSSTSCRGRGREAPRRGARAGAPRRVAGKGKANGMGAVPPESYTFPPVEPHMRRPEQVRRAPSPVEYDSRSYPGSEAASPAPFDVGRRLSVSAVRMAPRSPPEPPHTRKALAVHPTARERELSGPGYPPPPSAHPGHMGRIGIGSRRPAGPWL
ncbi:uncharacterized protein B0H18DRAFT_1082131 [Fomitopsis serialis]|uniref:uncharacterized protein n=1 Tax=Fomitopsis serialis TaxID=139415 RepID=UPI0020089A63|nr:uncharacterized protein B0H18DRAFT_1082131 [Neoantrodia serialis]KAH9936678.1 hypothetical protein B0H18DRAFT_1082131 [Neoantrodia serialis]